MTDSDTAPALRDLELAAAQASDDAAEWLGSLAALGRAVRAARTAGHTITGIGQELVQGRAHARYRRAQNRIRPSIRPRWPRIDSLPWWLAGRTAGASEEDLVEAAEIGPHRWGETYTALRYLPAGRPAGATLVDPGEVDQVAAVLAAYAAARTGGLDHDAAITRVVTWISSAIG